MPVLFGGKKIIPAPQANIEKDIRKGEDGVTRSYTYRITLRGKFVAYKGGVGWTEEGYPPDQSEYLNQDSRMSGLIDKMGALNDLFDPTNEGKLLEIYAPDSSAPIKCNPRIISISHPEGIWVETCDYQVTLEADKLYFGTHVFEPDILVPTEESWQLEQADERSRTWRFTHNVSASAKRSYTAEGTIEAEGWQNARARVLPSLGIDFSKMQSPDVLNLLDVTAYNYVRSENIDEASGRYSITENWLLFDLESEPDPYGTTIPCIDSFSISSRTGEDGRTRVSIEGTLTGLEVRDNTTYQIISTKWGNASAKYNALSAAILLNRAQVYSGTTLNPVHLNDTVGKNPETGVITYTREYDNRPANLIEGSITNNIQIADKLPGDVVAKIGVLNRPQGPILQGLNSKTEKARSLSIEVVVTPQRYGEPAPTKPDVTSIIALYGPDGAEGFTSVVGPFKERDDVNWQPLQGRYSRNISWIYE